MGKVVKLETGHNDSRSGGPSSPSEMHPPRKRAPLPPMPLECPNCQSPDVDEQARECRSCKIGLPDGARIRQKRTYVTTRDQRINTAIVRSLRIRGI